MSKENSIVQNGVIKEALPNTIFKVQLANGHEIIAHNIWKNAYELY